MINESSAAEDQASLSLYITTSTLGVNVTDFFAVEDDDAIVRPVIGVFWEGVKIGIGVLGFAR